MESGRVFVTKLIIKNYITGLLRTQYSNFGDIVSHSSVSKTKQLRYNAELPKRFFIITYGKENCF